MALSSLSSRAIVRASSMTIPSRGLPADESQNRVVSSSLRRASINVLRCADFLLVPEFPMAWGYVSWLAMCLTQRDGRGAKAGQGQ
jgi:hypothetical protein